MGNGTRRSTRWWEQPWYSGTKHGVQKLRAACMSNERKYLKPDAGSVHNDVERGGRKKKFSLFDFVACLKIICWKDSALILWMHGWFYLVDYCIQTVMPSIYQDVYYFNELSIGLSYLPRGAGVITGGYINGKLMNRKYRITAKEIGHTVDKLVGNDLNHFPIEKARCRDSWHLFATLSMVLIGHWWAVEKHVHISVPLILQYVQGILTTCLYTIFVTLLVNNFPESPSTAAAAASVARCFLAASGIAALEPLLDVLGIGWYSTALALIITIFGIFLVLGIQTYGRKWRSERRAKNTRPLRNHEESDEGYETPCVPDRKVDQGNASYYHTVFISFTSDPRSLEFYYKMDSFKSCSSKRLGEYNRCPQPSDLGVRRMACRFSSGLAVVTSSSCPKLFFEASSRK